MSQNKQKSEHTKLFGRSIFWLMMLIAAVGITYSYEKNLFQEQWDAFTASDATKELPIYCVKTDKPQVALSFDAAWGMQKCASEGNAHLRR